VKLRERAGGGEIVVAAVEDAESLVGDLFRRAFGDPLPSTPMHYVAFERAASGAARAVGYCHLEHHDGYALAGGLCVEPELRGRGIGKLLERHVFGDPGPARACFVHVGDVTRARRMGFVATGHPHLLVRWYATLPAGEQERLIGEVAALGPF
jgi:GNAT superfamily N-acetyltransferase